MWSFYKAFFQCPLFKRSVHQGRGFSSRKEGQLGERKGPMKMSKLTHDLMPRFVLYSAIEKAPSIHLHTEDQTSFQSEKNLKESYVTTYMCNITLVFYLALVYTAIREEFNHPPSAMSQVSG